MHRKALRQRMFMRVYCLIVIPCIFASLITGCSTHLAFRWAIRDGRKAPKLHCFTKLNYMRLVVVLGGWGESLGRPVFFPFVFLRYASFSLTSNQHRCNNVTKWSSFDMSEMRGNGGCVKAMNSGRSEVCWLWQKGVAADCDMSVRWCFFIVVVGSSNTAYKYDGNVGYGNRVHKEGNRDVFLQLTR